MPTYKRPAMLRRAVESVLRQTAVDWELLIGDDEDPPGEAWTYLQELTTSDPRISVLRNPGPHGQIGNNNFLLARATSPWIKPLFDDDALKPRCLERFLAAADADPTAAVIQCLADNFVDGRLARPGRRGAAALLERLTSRGALRAAYLQDLEVGTPVQCMVRGDLVRAGIAWEDPGGMNSAFDTWWLYRLMARGPALLLNEPLVDQHWGHATGTSVVQDDPALLDADLIRLRELLRPMIADEPGLPSAAAVRQQVRLMRAVLRVRDGRWGEALRLAMGVTNPQAWRLTFAWLRNKRRPGSRPLVPREALRTADG